MHADPKTISYIITGVIVVAILGWRLTRMSQARVLRLPTLLIAPVYLLAVSAFLVWRFPIGGLDWLWMTVVFVLGAAIGWWRGKMMQISVDPEKQALMVKASPWALIFLVGLIAVRFALREVFAENAAAWHVSFNLLTDAFVAFGLGVLGVTSLEMYLRARRLLAEHKAAATAAA